MKTLILALVFITSVSAQAQNKVDSNFIIYKMQLSKLLTTRGMNSMEIEQILSEYSKHRITSNENFAQLLGKIYPTDQGIGVLVYFFNADTLTRVFFEPGEIKSVDKVHITHDQLVQLKQDILTSLNVYKQSAKRSPKLRGVTTPAPKPGKFTFEEIVKKATRILLPESFDQKYKHLVIVPALNIGVIPFHLLKPYKDTSYFIDKCSFSIAPSLLDVIVMRGDYLRNIGIYPKNMLYESEIPAGYDWRSSFELKNALFVSNPLYPTNTSYDFPNLPGAKAEIDSAIKYAKNYTLLAGAKATKKAVLKEMNRRDLVYFATHGIASQESPMQKSFLVLSGTAPFLTAKEIMDLHEDIEFQFPKMVILSACQTGLGKYMEAGIAGLARPFLICGSKHVIMSLWNVDDKATAYLMSRFMFYLNQKHLFMPAGPLRLAILDTKIKYPNPELWASFSAFGVDQ